MRDPHGSKLTVLNEKLQLQISKAQPHLLQQETSQNLSAF
jgi:hypothetical protein